jgi:hypothetical protein
VHAAERRRDHGAGMNRFTLIMLLAAFAAIFLLVVML